MWEYKVGNNANIMCNIMCLWKTRLADLWDALIYENLLKSILHISRGHWH